MSTEFVKQSMRDNLMRVLVPHVSDGLWSVYDNALKACDRTNQPEKTLQTFQNLLTRVPQWTPEVLDTEVDRIVTASKCDYIEDMLLGVFVSYIRAFATLQQSEATHVNIEFERPSLSKFIHTYYTSCARKCWSQAYLFKTMGVSAEQQARNRRDIDAVLESTVGEVIDSFIPWREISRAYFHAKDLPSAAAPAPAPAPPPVTFQEAPKVVEFETDDEEESDDGASEDDRPKIALGEDVTLEDDDDDKASISTEDELLRKAGESENVALNL
jgi:hypothetical protein